MNKNIITGLGAVICITLFTILSSGCAGNSGYGNKMSAPAPSGSTMPSPPPTSGSGGYLTPPASLR